MMNSTLDNVTNVAINVWENEALRQFNTALLLSFIDSPKLLAE